MTPCILLHTSSSADEPNIEKSNSNDMPKNINAESATATANHTIKTPVLPAIAASNRSGNDLKNLFIRKLEKFGLFVVKKHFTLQN